MLPLKSYLFEIKWGSHALISLYVSIVSGIIIALQYNPVEPFFSTLTIELIVPYGSFWRGLHYYSSQLFFILLTIHIGEVIWENKHGYGRLQWIGLLSTFPVALLLLFTGYILRGDSTGQSAGVIAENIVLSVPLIGTHLNNLFFAISSNALKKIYAQHLIGLIILGGYFSWNHLRRHQTRLVYHLPVIGSLIIGSIFLPVKLEPEHPGAILIAGPWFFRGLQELLRYFPPVWGGIVFPFFFILLLSCLPVKEPNRKYTLWVLGLWLVIYTTFSVVGFDRI